MATEKQYIDKELGCIRIRVNRQARSIIMRPLPDGILVTLPPYSSMAKALQVLEQYRESLKRSQQTMQAVQIDLNFRLDAPLFKLSLVEGKQETKLFFLRREKGEIQLVCPPHTDFSGNGVQEWLHKAVEKCMHNEAKRLFPPRLQALAQQNGLSFQSVRISSSKGRWGSCSTKKSINLSLYMLLLPEHLIDYVMLHELAHTVEMNHGPRFWALLDRLTQGKAHSLRKELRTYHPSF